MVSSIINVLFLFDKYSFQTICKQIVKTYSIACVNVSFLSQKSSNLVKVPSSCSSQKCNINLVTKCKTTVRQMATASLQAKYALQRSQPISTILLIFCQKYLLLTYKSGHVQNRKKAPPIQPENLDKCPKYSLLFSSTLTSNFPKLTKIGLASNLIL